MSRIGDLLQQVTKLDAALGADLGREVKALEQRRPFGLNFERHQPETVELPGRSVRRGDKVRVLPARGSSVRPDHRLWLVRRVADGVAQLVELGAEEPEVITHAVDDLVVTAEFRDPIYPGLVSTGRVERGGDKPFHTVINGENFHALQALTYTHEGKVDAIYIDPPYNTGARDWKYNNDYVDGEDVYRHSKWLAFMERRLKLAKRLLNPENSVLVVTIDEKEYLRLGLLLQQVFPDARTQMVSAAINGAVVARGNAFGRADEYVYFVYVGEAAPSPLPLGPDWVSGRGVTHRGEIRWDRLIRSGTGTSRSDSPGGFYPIYVDPTGPRIEEIGDPLPAGTSVPPPVDGCVAVLPLRSNGSEGRWQMSARELASRLSQGRVRVGGNSRRGFTIYYLKDGEFRKVVDGLYAVLGRRADGSIITDVIGEHSTSVVPGTQWKVEAHDASHYGSRLLLKVMPDRKFPFPKSLYAVEDALRFFVADKPDAVVLDFFSGSGTTAHAVMRLNKQDGGRRQCISITNNEVGADEQKVLREKGLRPGDPEWERWGICDYITKPRIRAAITGRTPDGDPIKGDYKFTDEFPMADGFEENAEFFTLTYEAPRTVAHHRSFEAIAPLLWLKAGARGRRIDEPTDTFDVAETYGVLFDVDAATPFIESLGADVRLAYVVTDDDRAFQLVCSELPEHIEPVRLYESYLTNFTIGAQE
ncbi:MAG TPA: DNA methyltransferase [Nocardioides sp.]|uniref:site-specific DNA-methyltransferase n=1 Tax=Nocardioides sp. TaxID=35761 RepID=UPI002EDB013E